MIDLCYSNGTVMVWNAEGKNKVCAI